MATLLLRLAGPLQSWGTDSKFNTRGTSLEPSKSGVIGMVASALGRSRDQGLEDLNQLRFGVRVDQPGKIVSDFHMAHNPDIKNGDFVTKRYYLADSVFLAGLEGDWDFLKALDAAIKAPFYPLYLGRRSCVPAGRISLGVFDTCLEDSLRDADWQASGWYRKRCPPEMSLEAVLDCAETDSSVFQRDMPVSFSVSERKYKPRSTVRFVKFRNIDNVMSRRYSEKGTSHDAFSVLRGD